MIDTLYCDKVTFAGFGGQGIILMGKLLAQAALKNGYEVTYMPTYGAEVRGGTANCMVVISDEAVACPLISVPDALIVMNPASFKKFVPKLKNDGLLIMNSSMVDQEPLQDNVTVVKIPADKIALELDSPRSSNMVVLGAYLGMRKKITPEMAVACLKDVLAEHHHKTIPANTEALMAGVHFVQN